MNSCEFKLYLQIKIIIGDLFKYDERKINI